MNLRTVWSLDALDEFEEVYNYWFNRNKSDSYSVKLWLLVNRSIEILEQNPELGIPTNKLNIKMRLILINYYLIYKVEENHIEILKFWDVRQNPDKNIYNVR